MTTEGQRPLQAQSSQEKQAGPQPELSSVFADGKKQDATNQTKSVAQWGEYFPSIQEALGSLPKMA